MHSLTWKATAIGLAGLMAASSASLAQEVLATVNGEDITSADLEAAYSQLPPQYQQMPLEAIQGPLLDQLIDQQVLLGLAQERGLADDEAVQAAMQQAQDDVLRRELLEQAVAEATTDEAIQAAYEEQAAAAEPVEEVHARHILLESEEEAQAVIEELQDGGDFETLAQERSTGPSGPNGGDLGYFRKEAMVPEFAEAAFSMEPGTYTEAPVQTQFGWHVIKVEDKREAEPSLEELEAQIREDLARNAVAGLLDEARAGATIERTEAAPPPAQEPAPAAE